MSSYHIWCTDYTKYILIFRLLNYSKNRLFYGLWFIWSTINVLFLTFSVSTLSLAYIKILHVQVSEWVITAAQPWTVGKFSQQFDLWQSICSLYTICGSGLLYMQCLLALNKTWLRETLPSLLFSLWDFFLFGYSCPFFLSPINNWLVYMQRNGIGMKKCEYSYFLFIVKQRIC